MKTTTLSILILIYSFVYNLTIYAQKVDQNTTKLQAGQFWNLKSGDSEIHLETEFNFDNYTVARLYTHPQKGFVIISSDSLLKPILAYGNNFTKPGTEQMQIWETLLTTDYANRISNLKKLNVRHKHQDWTKSIRSVNFEQWPVPGSTPTGGWLWTNWKQTAPYNILCPMDLNSGNRSVVGCPATAMAQIFNFHRTINGTRMDDTDDYYHSYGAGNQFWIDDDYLQRFFPTFIQLNRILDSTESFLNQGITLTDSMAAALSFVSGIAAKQVYSSSVSGTFGLEQALWGIHRFGFEYAELIEPTDTTLNSRIAENIKNALPVQLGLLVNGGGGGHNVVVDGYNTDEYYHFNFGWGGSSNGWYTLPPVNIPYNLTIIEGAVVEIRGLHTGYYSETKTKKSIKISSESGYRIKMQGLVPGEEYRLCIYSINGTIINEISFTATHDAHITHRLLNRNGIVVCLLMTKYGQYSQKLFIRP